MIQLSRARPHAYPMLENVGNMNSGNRPNRLFTQMKQNSPSRYGKYGCQPCPIVSRATPLRMNVYRNSLTNWPLPGTVFSRRDAISQNTRIRITESSAWISGLLTQSTPGMKPPLNSKSSRPGGLKPSPPVSSGIRTGISEPTDPPLPRSCEPTGQARSVLVPRIRRSAVPPDDQVDGPGHAEDDADRHQEPGLQQLVPDPAQAAVAQHPGDQVRQHPQALVHARGLVGPLPVLPG